MKFWLNANLSPKLARWIEANFACSCKTLQELGLRDESDEVLFEKARLDGAIVITKDSDFREMVLRLGAPPQVLWITIGNTSTKYLISILTKAMPEAIEHLKQGAPLVEIGH